MRFLDRDSCFCNDGEIIPPDAAEARNGKFDFGEHEMGQGRYFALACCLTAIATMADSAVAATISYDLTGNINNLSTVYGDAGVDPYGGPYTDQSLSLVNAATGLNQLPGITLSVGDTINGTVTLSNPLTVPDSVKFTTIGIDLLAFGISANIAYQESVSFYRNNVQVALPAALSPYSGSGTPLDFGEFSIAGTSSFTFDKIVFDATVTGMEAVPYQPVSSLTLTTYSPELLDRTYQAPVPLPAAAWLMLSGLGGLGALARKRKAA